MKLKLSILPLAVVLTVIGGCGLFPTPSVKLERELRKDIEDTGAKIHRLSDEELKVIIPSAVLFDFDSNVLKPGFETIVQKIAFRLGAYKTTKIEVNGYTDNVGTANYNQRLSERRATSVSDALTKNDVSSARLTTKGFGMSDPSADNTSAEGRAQNRRVEVVIHQ